MRQTFLVVAIAVNRKPSMELSLSALIHACKILLQNFKPGFGESSIATVALNSSSGSKLKQTARHRDLEGLVRQALRATHDFSAVLTSTWL